MTAVIEDLSAGGMAVSAEHPLLAGDRVAVQGKRGSWAGTIRHCTPRDQDGAYQIGIRFE